jgi:hypothetical protein
VPNTLDYEPHQQKRRGRFWILGFVIRVHVIASYASAAVMTAFFVYRVLSGQISFTSHALALQAFAVGVSPLFIFYVMSLLFPIQTATPITIICSTAYLVVVAALIWRARNRRVDGSIDDISN